MRLSQYIDRQPEIRHKKVRPARAGIATHGAFVPILGLWGAALLGLSVLVLPEATVQKFSALSDGAVAGAAARLTFAGVAAVLGAAAALVVGGALRSAALSRDSQRPIVSAINARKARPIDPATELGSPSLDAPLDDEVFLAGEEEAEFEPVAQDFVQKRGPTLGELSQRGYEMAAPEDRNTEAREAKPEIAFTHRDFQPALIESCEGASCEASGAPGDAPSGASDTVSPIVHKPARTKPAGGRPQAETRPRNLDLEEFGRLPGRNAVWVEGEAGASPQDARTGAARTGAARPGPVPATALQKLRQVPADRLSLVEMVERFAGALHEHQQSERARRPDHASGRDAALVEALKALTLFTEQGFDRPAAAQSPSEQLGRTERELRDALAKLQTLRGAA